MTIALVATALLLLASAWTRQRVSVLGRLHLPISVIAGFVGLFIVQIAAWWLGEGFSESPVGQLQTEWDSWPGWLIAVVFAGMLIERAGGSAEQTFRQAATEGLMVWIIVLGETAVGLLATWLIIGPMFGVPSAFGMLIETGFAGGHGTAAAMGEVFATESVGVEGGGDLGMMMATFGLVYGIVTGVVWVNWGVRRGWTGNRGGQPTPVHPATTGQTAPHQAPAKATLGLNVILLQIIWLAIAVGIGLALQHMVQLAGVRLDQWIGSESAEIAVDRGRDAFRNTTRFASILGSFPLFIFTLFGGWIVRKMLHTTDASELVDGRRISELTGIAMDILVVAAIASLNLSAVSTRLGELLVLMVAGAVWTAFCLLVLARRILPSGHWFELGLINYGMSTGTTATGFVLLKMVDPKLASGAAEDYALAAPLSSPFIGGGMLTIALPLLVLPYVPLAWVTIGLSAVIATLIWIGCKLK